jgi:iron complex transport system permease protein
MSASATIAMTPPGAQPVASSAARTRRTRATLVLLGVAVVVAAVVACGIGAHAIAPGRVVGALLAPLTDAWPWAPSDLEVTVVWSLRLPRVLLAVVVGAALAGGGVALQGVVRNPLADAGILGVQTGASLGAIGFLVLGSTFVPAGALAAWMVILAAFLGALASTLVVVALARVDGRPSTTRLVLSGVALAALGGALSGMVLQIASDSQLRSVTFWNMGSLAGATWPTLAVVSVVVTIALLVVWRQRRALDLLLLGEREAGHLGVDVDALAWRVIVAVALAVGAVVAVCGAIGFVGLVVPHVVRGWLGPRHGALLPASILGGALLMVAADTVARTIVAPAELPIGILTALLGTPVLLVLIRKGEAPA